MNRITSYLLVGLHTLIAFFLIVGERLLFPPWLQSVGRVHPLFLHIPIGVLVVLIVLVFFGQALATRQMISFLLAVVALTAAITAFMGMVLGAEEGYDAEVLNRHRIAGISLSLFAWIALHIYNRMPERKLLFNGVLVASTLLLLAAGHLGSAITHGDQFVLAPLFSDDTDEAEVTDSTTIYRAAVQPILEQKCMSCHNDNKRKGKLSMESVGQILAGGEHGPLWERGEPKKSLVMARILLPEDHKEHMPPAGKPQLTLTEANFLYQWIQSGADTALAWTAYHERDTVRILARLLMKRRDQSPKPRYEFEEPSEKVIAELNDPYRTVRRVAIGEPALSASFYIRESYTPERLTALSRVKEQVVELNLDGMPVTDADCETISEFKNLENLNLNFSDITRQCIAELASLPNLRSLAVAGTRLDEEALLLLNDFPSLEKAFIWETAVKDSKLLATKLAAIKLDSGDPARLGEVLRLSPPLLVNESMILDDDSISLSHKLPGVLIRYTTSGVDPDSTSEVYNKPLHINSSAEIRAIACKAGWYCSYPVRFLMFRKGLTPQNAVLNKQPDKDYRGAGARTVADNKKGFADNYRGDVAWLGYREQPFDATFSFDAAPEVDEITISYARNVPSFLFPPAKVEVWAGDDLGKMSIVRQVDFQIPEEKGDVQIEALKIPLDHATYHHYRIVVRPFPQLPKWHPANKKDTKDKRTWIFIDEVFFN